MTDQELSVRTLSRRAMDHALALTLPHAGEEERNALLATALCVDVVPAALAVGLRDAASLLGDPLVREQVRALIHGTVARMAGPEGAALLTQIESSLDAVLPGFGARPAGECAGPCARPAPPVFRCPHWRLDSPREAGAPDDVDVAVARYVMDDPEGLPPGARYVPGSLRVRELGTPETPAGRWVSLTAQMQSGSLAVERRSEVPSPAMGSHRDVSGPLRARLTVTPEGFPCVELAQPLAPLREVPVDVVAEEAPAPAPRPLDVNFLPPDLVAASEEHLGDACVAKHVGDILGAPGAPATPSED